MMSEYKQAPGKPWELILAYGIISLGVMGYLIHCYQRQDRVVDDAYISWRFAQHLADGYGLVWNIGGEPVEGYTSMLWVLVLALLGWMGFDIQMASYVIAVLSVLGVVAILIAIVHRHMGGMHPWLAVVIIFFLIDTKTAIHTFSGMETQFAVLCLAIMSALTLRFIDRRNIHGAVLLAVSMFAAILCRPDAATIIAGSCVALGLATLFPSQLGLKKMPFVPVATCAVLFIALLAVYGVAKYRYFGYLLPNPYYVKSGLSDVNALMGLPEVITYIKETIVLFKPLEWVIPLLLLAIVLQPKGLIATGRGVFNDASARLKALAIALSVVLALSYNTTIIHEAGFNSRFSYPTIYLVILLAAGLIYLLLLGLTLGRHRMRVTLLVTLIAVASIYLSGDWRLENAGPRFYHSYHERMANALAATGLGSKATVTTSAAGLIPYRSGFNHIDPIGLVENTLSGRTDMSTEEREAYLWSLYSDVYLGTEPPASPGATGPEDEPAFQSMFVKEHLLRPPMYRLQFYRNGVVNGDTGRKSRLLFNRMKQLRDNWVFLGEMQNEKVNKWMLIRCFVYVRRDSPYFATLYEGLQTLIDVPPDAIDLNSF
jgi:hypothetical protein